MMNQQKHIAIVDDHSMFRKGLGILIDLFPRYKVTLSAANGKDFIRQLEDAPLPDIVLMDIAMPEMDGYTLCTWVTLHHPSIRTLALSTMDSEAAIIRMISAGARGYLHKDAEADEIKLAFEEVMTFGHYFNEEMTRKLFRLTGPGEGTADMEVSFTEEELSFLRLICSERSYDEIAWAMAIPTRRVEEYLESFFRRWHVRTRVGLAMIAVQQGLVKPLF
jgi:DNA-binding NarL/FixJ family response regulator